MDNYVFYEDSKPVLERLKGTYRLGVISDTWPSAEPYCAAAAYKNVSTR
jgi:ribonuclease HI